MASHVVVDAARCGAPVLRALGSGLAVVDGPVGHADSRQPGLARDSCSRLGASAAWTVRDATLGTLLVGRLGGQRCALGLRRAGDVSAVARAPGAPDRMHLRRGARRTQRDRGLSPGVLRLRAPRPAPAHRAGGVRRRPGALVHRARDERRARFHSRLRPPAQRVAHPLARDALRKPRPHRGAQGKVARRARGAHIGRSREPQQEPAPGCSKP